MKYVYTAVFTPSEDNAKIYARVPDLPGCVTTGRDIQDAMEQISDAASGWLVVAEDEGLEIPSAAPQSRIPRNEEDTLSLVRVDTVAYRAMTDTHAVRKNVSLPAWMANLADKRGINCSQILQEGLRLRLSAEQSIE